MKEHKNTKKRQGNLGENEPTENIHFLGNDERTTCMGNPLFENHKSWEFVKWHD